MLAIEPLRLDGAEEELRAVGAGASIGHGQDTCATCEPDQAKRQVAWSSHGNDEDNVGIVRFRKTEHNNSFWMSHQGGRGRTGASVLEGEVLIRKLLAIDGLAAGPVLLGEVATLSIHSQCEQTAVVLIDSHFKGNSPQQHAGRVRGRNDAPGLAMTAEVVIPGT